MKGIEETVRRRARPEGLRTQGWQSGPREGGRRLRQERRRTYRRGRRIISAVAFVLAFVSLPATARAADVLVLEFELNDLTLYPNVEQEEARVASLRPLLVETLDPLERVTAVAPGEDAAREAGRGNGYLFDRPEVAARLARAADADWALTGRLHKASHLFVYLKAQLVDARDGRIAADFVVEIKGWGEKLTRKGVETLAVQLTDALDELEDDSAIVTR